MKRMQCMRYRFISNRLKQFKHNRSKTNTKLIELLVDGKRDIFRKAEEWKHFFSHYMQQVQIYISNEERISFQLTSHQEGTNPGNKSRKEIRMLNALHWNVTDEIAKNLVSSSRWFIISKIIYMRSKLVTLAFHEGFFHIFNNIAGVLN